MNDKLKLKGHMKAFMRWPLILSALLIVLNILVYCVSVKAGLVVSAGVLIYVGIAVVVLRCHRPFIVNELIAFANQYDSLEKRILEELALPYAIMDMNGRMIWSNKVFAELTGKDQFYKKNISTIFPDVTADKLPVADKKEISEISTQFGEKIYRVSMQRVELGEIVAGSETLENTDKNVSLIAMYMYDDTELKEYIKKNEDNKLVVALAYLDNYEEALESVEDVRRSLLIALIDRKITKYFSNFDGLVKKLEKDKYFLIMRQSSLDTLKEQRFHILDEVKTVNIGNEMAITLSIGVGLNAATYIQNYEYSRIAIEMALGRGGDQVVIKNGNNITYYGGKTQQMEKATRVKARVKAQALKEFMSTKDRVVVMGHKITDVDALGAGIGIYRAGKTLGKPVHIVVNDPTKSIRPLIAEYTNNSEYEPSMFVDSAQAKDLIDNNTVVVVVDTNRPSYTECEELLYMTKTVVVLDHHRRGSEVIENAVLSYVEPYASSACEMVAEILQYFSDDLRIRNIEADCLYAGIVIDTNNFTTRAGVRTFEAAAFLRRSGADVTRVRKLLRDDLKSYQARADAVRTAHIYRNCFAISTCPSENLDSPTVVGAQAANELLNIAGVKASFVLTQYNNEIYISARAIDEINVQVMMEKMGGGGHMNIAGAQVKASPDEVERMLKDIIDQEYQEENIK
ncbi:DHH family phosphoesterase [Ruminococcus sp. AF37-6AT]|uniref:DHH family phosphoesterase n=1 Tax=Blautia sp. HCN-1074 TaxID=3134667 RepID=UPI000E43572E|nr:DHH family phosphoesterase [uncultured Blautia sp.]RGI59447.1 DHH family phosphoesterase [Ruminococcus sp. TM10-9AT]RGW21600.1 DHH family phosphoesterase [Ruminococcus sp. AF13-37]RGW24254.1 DHH family phosphoesterase [Ruminococcus sp. AF13-28]RGY93166.1 DHH family phosphoesterase [Ruminococcus sp. AM58-7XD]RHG54109.1 DHH family phosphoesterase [Ruminococcus sp. AM22-13]RHJ93920.1 DHH family phosphoesterase [Ruminococcus sp. AM07-21]RHL44782.1 DHH family phosphoesterase [Ruminococcus sp. 